MERQQDNRALFWSCTAFILVMLTCLTIQTCTGL